MTGQGNKVRKLRVLLRPARSVDRQDLKAAYRKVFSGPLGELVLEDICAGFKQAAKNTRDAAAMADARAFQDGREEVMLHIIRMLEA